MITNLKAWGLSKGAIEILSGEPEIVEYLATQRYLAPFPSDYQPIIWEIRFDDLTYYYQNRGEMPYIRPSLPDYQPLFSQYLIDEKLLVFKVRDELIIERSSNLCKDNFGWVYDY